MEQQVRDKSVEEKIARTNLIMWVNTIANVVGTIALIGIALLK